MHHCRSQYVYIRFSGRKIPRTSTYAIVEKAIQFRHPDYDPDQPQKLTSSSMSRHLSTRNISSKSMHALWVILLTDRQTDRQRNAFTYSFVRGNNMTTFFRYIQHNNKNWSYYRGCQKTESYFKRLSMYIAAKQWEGTHACVSVCPWPHPPTSHLHQRQTPNHSRPQPFLGLFQVYALSTLQAHLTNASHIQYTSENYWGVYLLTYLLTYTLRQLSKYTA